MKSDTLLNIAVLITSLALLVLVILACFNVAARPSTSLRISQLESRIAKLEQLLETTNH